jgi:hypothetical protein
MAKSRMITFLVFLSVGTAIVAPALLSERAARILLDASIAVLGAIAIFAAIVFIAYRLHLRLNKPEAVPAVREVPESTGIQVLGTFLSDGEGGDTR